MVHEMKDILSAEVSPWFERHAVVGIELPSGWFGRPHDGQHRLTYSSLTAERLILAFDAHHVLIFVRPRQCDAEEHRLVIGEAEFIIWSWDESLAASQLQTFKSGDVVFHSPQPT